MMNDVRQLFQLLFPLVFVYATFFLTYYKNSICQHVMGLIIILATKVIRRYKFIISREQYKSKFNNDHC